MTDVTAAPRAPIDAGDWAEIPEGMTPADAVAQLAADVPERTGDDYLVYERHGCWTLAIGARTSIELDRDECRIGDGHAVVTHTWGGRPPAQVLADASTPHWPVANRRSGGSPSNWARTGTACSTGSRREHRWPGYSLPVAEYYCHRTEFR